MINFEIKWDYKIIVYEILSWIGIENVENINSLNEFLNELQDYSTFIPLRQSKIGKVIQNETIMNKIGKYTHEQSDSKII